MDTRTDGQTDGRRGERNDRRRYPSGRWRLGVIAWILIEISLKIVPRCPINNIPVSRGGGGGGGGGVLGRNFVDYQYKISYSNLDNNQGNVNAAGRKTAKANWWLQIYFPTERPLLSALKGSVARYSVIQLLYSSLRTVHEGRTVLFALRAVQYIYSSKSS